MSRTEVDEIRLTTASGDSRVVVAPGLLGQLGALTMAQWPGARTAWVISDERVAALHGQMAVVALEQAGLRVALTTLPEGEATKTLGSVAALYDWLLGGGISRGDVIVALGGGVVGDLAGFVAATCLRGVPLVQAPTSLLAMVDSSVGGKTGVNHPTGKNLIGAFYQPPLVVVDPTLLATLPTRELAAGWAEVIKYGFIERSVPGLAASEPVLLPKLEAEAEALLRLAPEATADVVRHCIGLKARVVEADPLEQGVRVILNYGHTAGHALEAAAGYGRFLHGEAVAVGMRVAASIAVALGRCQPALLARQQALVRRFGLPETAPGLDPAAIWPYMRRDKKATAGQLRWILPSSPGVVEVVQGVDEATIDQALAQATGA